MKTSSAFFALALTSSLTLSAQPSVQVVASGQHHGGKVVYRYHVVNGSAAPLKRIVLGQRIADNGDGALELGEMPLGGTTSSFWLPAESVGRPAGWGAKFVFAEGSERFALEFIDAKFYRERFPRSPVDLENAPQAGLAGQPISPGQMTNSMFVVVDRVDTAYVSGHVTVEVGDSVTTGVIVKGDTSAPQLSVSAERINANEGRGQWAIFRLNASVSDNEDPSPLLSVDPIVANGAIGPGDVLMEKNSNSAWNLRLRNMPGRKYTMTFRAMDASGNRSVKSFEYEVPAN